MSETTIAIPERDTSVLTSLIPRFDTAVSTLTITNDEQYQGAGALLTEIIEREKQAEEFLAEDIETANRLHKSLTKKRGILKAPWSGFRATISNLMGDYKRKREREAAETERQLERDRQRLLQEAEDEAARLRRRGDVKAARQITQQAQALTDAPVMAPPAPKVEGLREPEKWTGICDDPMALLKAVVEGRIPLMHETRVQGQVRQEPLFTVNQRVLDQAADRMRDEFNWPGCRSDKTFGFARTGR